MSVGAGGSLPGGHPAPGTGIGGGSGVGGPTPSPYKEAGYDSSSGKFLVYLKDGTPREVTSLIHGGQQLIRAGLSRDQQAAISDILKNMFDPQVIDKLGTRFDRRTLTFDPAAKQVTYKNKAGSDRIMKFDDSYFDKVKTIFSHAMKWLNPTATTVVLTPVSSPGAYPPPGASYHAPAAGAPSHYPPPPPPAS